MKTIHIEDIDNLNFWTSYFGCSYPNSYVLRSLDIIYAKWGIPQSGCMESAGNCCLSVAAWGSSTPRWGRGEDAIREYQKRLMMQDEQYREFLGDFMRKFVPLSPVT